MFFFISRAAGYNFIVAYLFEHPIVQASLMVAMSAVIFVYLIAKKPFTSWIGLLEICLYEICVVVCNSLVLAMAIWDEQGVVAEDQREFFGKVIIWTFFAFSVIALIFLGLSFVLGLIALIKAIKNYKKGEKINCLELLTLPF